MTSLMTVVMILDPVKEADAVEKFKNDEGWVCVSEDSKSITFECRSYETVSDAVYTKSPFPVEDRVRKVLLDEVINKEPRSDLRILNMVHDRCIRRNGCNGCRYANPKTGLCVFFATPDAWRLDEIMPRDNDEHEKSRKGKGND